jgi:hypothetical protein
MLQLQEQHPEMSDKDIMQEVLGVRRGWERGVGPKISLHSSVAAPPHPPQRTDQRMFSQAEVEDVVASRLANEREQWQTQMMAQMMSQMQTQFQSQLQNATAPIYDALKNRGTFQTSEEDEGESSDS